MKELNHVELVNINGGEDDSPCGTFIDGFVAGFTGTFKWIKDNLLPFLPKK